MYARHTFAGPLEAPPPGTNATVRMLVDDGAAVYVNGKLVQRYNLPGAYRTPMPLGRARPRRCQQLQGCSPLVHCLVNRRQGKRCSMSYGPRQCFGGRGRWSTL